MKNHSPFDLITNITVIKTFAVLLAVAFLLRVFYAGHLYQDDGLWFAAAEELLRGKSLYSEIYFDKPPALPLLYALLFKLFGAHILTIRLFTIFYSIIVAFVLYLFSSLLYDRRKGLLAAAMFTVFSTTYTTGHVQGLNTDFLMTLPYALGAYLFARSYLDKQATKAGRLWLTFGAGAATGVAFQTNPKAIFNLLFFVLCSLFLAIRQDSGFRIQDSGGKKSEVRSLGERSQESEVRSQNMESENQEATDNDTDNNTHHASHITSHLQFSHRRLLPTAYCLLLVVAGFVAGALPFWAYIAARGALYEYWANVWQWGAKYTAYYSIGDSVVAALRQSLSYFALNGVLLVGLVFVAVSVLGGLRKEISEKSEPARGAGSESACIFNADVILLLWFATSYAGMSVGGRFFGHYFFQILPSLCLLGARGVTGIIEALRARGDSGQGLRRVVFAVLLLGFSITLVRFHARTAVLATDWARGAKSQLTGEWFHERLNREEKLAAAYVKDTLEADAEIEKLRTEEIRERSPVKRMDEECEECLFVWGYRPEIYFWSGLRPASRFLSTQPLTGVPADVHYFGEAYVPVLDAETTAVNRRQLLQDLQANPPKYIVDELGFFNADLAITNYPELKSFLEGYKLAETRGRFLIYFRRAPKEKKNNGASVH